MHKISYFQRKRRQGANYSLEQVFDDLISRINSRYQINRVIMPFISLGILKRIWNALYVIFHQGEVNHITGDIYYTALFLQKRKTVTTVLDLGVVHERKGLRKKILLNVWFKWPVARSKWVTVISEATKIDLIKQTKCNPDKVKVVYVPISEEFKPVKKEFNEDFPTILQIGAAPNKNLKGLIKAVKDLKCKLLIIGKISEENQRLLSEYDIAFENKVGIPFKEVIAAYEKSDLLFFASTFEGFGMPILEAQAVGRPVVTSNLLSMPEVGGNACLYVDPYDTEQIKEAILTIVKDKSKREKMIANGFQNVLRFSGEHIAGQYEELYQNILRN